MGISRLRREVESSRSGGQARSPIPPWNGSGLAAAFAAHRNRAWTLGYESINGRVIEGSAKWVGSFPPELRGTLFRNGPARHERGGQRYAHRWDGDGMVQRFDLTEAGVTHLGRFVETHKFLAEEEAGRMIYSGFGTPVDRAEPTPQRIEESNPANINIVRFNDEYLRFGKPGAHTASIPGRWLRWGQRRGWKGALPDRVRRIPRSTATATFGTSALIP